MKFGVRLEGENYEIMFEGKTQLLGFVTTRIVKAENPEQAELEAVDLIKNDRALNNIMLSGSSYTSTIRVTEMWQESWWKRPGGKGFTFFPMDSEK